MAVFTYSALKKDGTTANGELTANDRADAFRRLDRNGLQPVALKQKDAAALPAPASDKKNGKETAVARDAKKAKEEKKQELALAKSSGKTPAVDASGKEVV